MWMPVSISTLLLALISMMTTGIHKADSFCVLGTLTKYVVFPEAAQQSTFSLLRSCAVTYMALLVTLQY